MVSVAKAPKTQKRILFVFPGFAGHVNPSLPIARSLCCQGHDVHYMCRESMRAAIEDTGAKFYLDSDHQPELYSGREPDNFGALQSLQKEHAIEDDGLMVAHAKLSNVELELQLPGMLRFLQELRPHVVIFCPMCNREAVVAASILEIPSIALITHAGPGSFETLTHQFLSELKLTADDMRKMVTEFDPNTAATLRLNTKYGLQLDFSTLGVVLRPPGKIPSLANSSALVTTSEGLADRMSPGLEKSYESDGTVFSYVGPLLDQEGAARAGVVTSTIGVDVVERVRSARVAGRTIVLVSMGTVLTSDEPTLGWNERLAGPDGKPRGLTGRELVQGAWMGAFDAFGARNADEGPLLVVSVSKRPDALKGVQSPPNAVCLPSIQQVDILKAGVDIFLTHGGQNSFTEAMSQAVPVVVCPGFGDQKVNSRKAVELGVGLKVDRPDPDAGGEAVACAGYRKDVCSALLQVVADQSFKAGAQRCREQLEGAGGVSRAVDIVLAQAKVRRREVASTAGA